MRESNVIDLFIACMQKAIKREELGDFNKAGFLYSRLMHCPDPVIAKCSLNNLGAIHLGWKQYHCAQVVFEESTKLYPDFSRGWLGYAISLERQGKTEAALSAYMTVYPMVELHEKYGTLVADKIKTLNIALGKIREIY